MGNLAFQDVDLLLSDIQRSAPNREFLGLQSVQELAKAVQFIGWVGVVHKPMISRWPLFDQTATRARSVMVALIWLVPDRRIEVFAKKE